MKPFKEYIGDILVYLLIAFWLWMLYFWFRLIFIFIKEEDYKTLIFFLILSGIAIIVVGYISKSYVYNRSIAGAYIIEYFQELRKKQELKERISLNDKLDLWALDGYGVKIGNRIGITLISIGAIIYIVKYIL
ncbi:hypothetical protein A7H1H_0493 [Aliarcobacter butzleri 7h1h]|uniref:hypothetical protein n=1 Tax=Aliarcobacter TaxID=2321111 RepID=UPI0002F277AB|nr:MULTISPECIES: hypothetical protein [Aliarcobacter]AGR76816.1 hypothetical protein A7H1H_0493 [Aliarcobacter butzleri 7h1h]MBL3519703.1 hypothetical protein [Aliarcobacter lanthieri]MDN5072076.1 hypothetical protein [Aliarcobacter butzleri]MDN5120965.1 hypothetical protein [Aliarcobacter butzleri]MDN5129177.1 hypothetical protein [Aliarcobacter butzleri]